MTPEEARALDVARRLIRAGIPVFAAKPATDREGRWDPGGGHDSCGFWLPSGWQKTVPTEHWLDASPGSPLERKAWRPGWALGAVMGHGLDLLDVDPRNGGEETRAGMVEAGMWPRTYALADTPSGGVHELVASLGVGSRDAVRAGLDVKAGLPDGSGRGFGFIAPTVKRSKVTGEVAGYRWRVEPDLEALAERGDDTGAALTELIRAAQGRPNGDGSPLDGLNPNGSRWPHTGPIPDGQRYPMLRSYAGSLRRRDVHLDEALVLLRRRWEECAQPPDARYRMPWEDAEALLRDIYGRYPPGAVPTPEEASGSSSRAAGAAQRPHRAIRLTPASSIVVRPVRWLWSGRLALGSLGLLGGREGIGKSTVAYTLAADVTRGRLRGAFEEVPKAVIVAAAEDSWEHTIGPRLMGSGADLSRVYRVDVTTSDGVDTGLSLPKDLPALERAVAEVDAALILLDPLLSRLDAALDTHRDADVRLALEPLVRLADASGAAVLGLIHVNKSTSTDPLTVLMGSRAFAAVARAVLFVMTDPDDDTLRLLGQPKNNLGRTDLPTLTFRIDTATVAVTDEGPVTTGKVNWIGETERSIRDVLAAAEESAETRSATGEANPVAAGLPRQRRRGVGLGEGEGRGPLGRPLPVHAEAGQPATEGGQRVRGVPAPDDLAAAAPVGPRDGDPVSSTSRFIPGESGLTELTESTELTGTPVGSVSSVGAVGWRPHARARGGPTGRALLGSPCRRHRRGDVLDEAHHRKCQYDHRTEEPT